MSDLKNRDTALYRLYDADDRLLYVGIATDPKVRFTQHRKDKRWWGEVAVREVEWFTSRSEAEREELRAIRKELPRYNDMGVQWPHHLLGQAPAELMTMTEFRVEPIRTIDRVVASGQPVILTRKAVPLVVLVPYIEPNAESAAE